MGLTFKENCPDIRNSRAIDIIRELEEYGCDVEVSDPWADSDEVLHEYNLKLRPISELESYAGIILAVSHEEFLQDILVSQLRNYSGVIYDVKSILPQELVSNRL